MRAGSSSTMKNKAAHAEFFGRFLALLPAFAFLQTGFADAGGLQTNVAVDLVGAAPLRRVPSQDAHFLPREAEISLYGPIDHIFDGLLGLAAHFEDGKAGFEIHEASIASTKLIPNMRIRMGQFFLGVGKLNATHRHDWPFIDAPAVQKKFFGSEGVSDSGIEVATQLPVSHPIEFTAGVTQGWTFGHTHSAGDAPKTPTHFGRLATFFSLPSNGGHLIALNYVGRTDGNKQKTDLIGIDSTMKWREGKTLPFLMQSELWWRSLKPHNERPSESLGFYLYPQVSLTDDLYFGLVYDQYSPTNLVDVTGQRVFQKETAWIPNLTWKPSEFSTLRLNTTWQFESKQKAKDTPLQSFIQFQSVFILGAHPAHDF